MDRQMDGRKDTWPVLLVISVEMTKNYRLHFVVNTGGVTVMPDVQLKKNQHEQGTNTHSDHSVTESRKWQQYATDIRTFGRYWQLVANQNCTIHMSKKEIQYIYAMHSNFNLNVAQLCLFYKRGEFISALTFLGHPVYSALTGCNFTVLTTV